MFVRHFGSDITYVAVRKEEIHAAENGKYGGGRHLVHIDSIDHVGSVVHLMNQKNDAEK